MRRRSLSAVLTPALLAPLLAGCVVRTAANIATAPVRAAGWTADKLTTSQAEADRNRGRKMRHEEERRRREERRAARAADGR